MTRNKAKVHTPHTTRGNILDNGKPARKMVKASRLMKAVRQKERVHGEKTSS